MRQNPHVRICGGPGSATTLVYPTADLGGVHNPRERMILGRRSVSDLRSNSSSDCLHSPASSPCSSAKIGLSPPVAWRAARSCAKC